MRAAAGQGLSRPARSPATRPASRARATAVSRTSCPSWARRAISAAAGRPCRATCTGWAASAVSPATARARSRSASARWSVLRADVCAICHDAPPRYGHVAAWRGTAMARADANPRARTERACARCHTTAGFLETVSTPERQPVDRRTPDGVGPVGISCSACHAVHDPKRPQAARASPRATRRCRRCSRVRPANVCLPCHTPDAADARAERIGGRGLAGARRPGSGDGRAADRRPAARRDRGRLRRLPPRRTRPTWNAAPATASARRRRSARLATGRR